MLWEMLGDVLDIKNDLLMEVAQCKEHKASMKGWSKMIKNRYKLYIYGNVRQR